MRSFDGGDMTLLAVTVCFVTFICTGLLADSLKKGGHSYHAARVISYDGKTLIRAVESPAEVDDNVVEIIIDGKIVSRTHPDLFEKIWENAK